MVLLLFKQYKKAHKMGFSFFLFFPCYFYVYFLTLYFAVLHCGDYISGIFCGYINECIVIIKVDMSYKISGNTCFSGKCTYYIFSSYFIFLSGINENSYGIISGVTIDFCTSEIDIVSIIGHKVTET